LGHRLAGRLTSLAGAMFCTALFEVRSPAELVPVTAAELALVA